MDGIYSDIFYARGILIWLLISKIVEYNNLAVIQTHKQRHAGWTVVLTMQWVI